MIGSLLGGWRRESDQLARLREAELLLNGGEWSGAYCPAGYAVECGLKACIARLTNLHGFPEKERVVRIASHKIEVFVKLADFKTQRDADAAANPALDRNWPIVRSWTETSRYARATESQARLLFAAISHPAHGVLPWIMRHW